MAEDIKVNLKPIQRNLHDVALELTQLYYENHHMGDVEEVQEIYARFYAIAAKMDYLSNRDFDKMISEEVIDNLI
ncbi:MAG: hypothetical protein ACOX1R_02885 [Caldicoprobacterales bacterium]|nr:hypothetical protein [Clostridiales bacterium]